MSRDRYDDRPRGRQEDDDGQPSRSKTLLVVFGIVGGMLLVCGGLGTWGAVYLVGRAQEEAVKKHEAAARMHTTNQMKEATIGLHAYSDTYGKLPGPCVDNTTFGAFGSGPAPAKLSDRLSWRYSLLPFVEQGSLYNGMDPSQAWNAGANQTASNTPIRTYGDPLDPTDNQTRFRCFYDNGALWETDPSKRVAFYNVPDGTTNTILFVETTDRVPWAQFNDLKFDPNGGPPRLGHEKRDVFLVGMADGSVRSIKKTIDPAMLKAAITANGDDNPGPEFKDR